MEKDHLRRCRLLFVYKAIGTLKLELTLIRRTIVHFPNFEVVAENSNKVEIL
jgi:hypothetical protein